MSERKELGQSLPAKEASLFRMVVKCYEGKQYKKGLKSADQVLKKFPDHGETLSMKGLTLNCLGRKEEAYELVRKGLKCDLKSHVCWHVFGLLYRSDRVYNEAAKCYLNALRIDKDNLQILQDLALLQVQLRDYAGFVATRHLLLKLKPTNRNNWICLAISHHLSGNLDVAVTVLEQYATFDKGAGEKYEHSEVLLYHASILEEGGRVEEAAAFLEASRHAIVDKVGLLEALSRLNQRLGKADAAEAGYRRLLSMNPDCLEYHVGLRRALALEPEGGPAQLTDAQIATLTEEYAALRAKHAFSSACRRVPLDFLRGPAFEAALAEYVRAPLRKGVPSLFAALKPLYASKEKVPALEKVVTEAEAGLRERNAFPGAAEESEAPGVAAWALMLLAQHEAELGRLPAALAAIDRALAHTPTVIDFYLVKSDLLSAMGDAAGAAAIADEARGMDLADRYLNCVAVQKMLAAGELEKAEATVVLFARTGDVGPSNLIDMQCMWYELASGACHVAAQSWGPALKRFHQVKKHFEDFQEDQFDFHTYCVRKSTLRAYVGMLRMADTLSGHDHYRKAAAGAVRVYLAIEDERRVAAEGAAGFPSEAELAAMAPNDRKKVRAKQRKAEQAAAKKKEEEVAAAAAKEAATPAKPLAKGEKPKERDPDPNGRMLADAADPLGEAVKFLEILITYAGSELPTQLLAFEVYRRKGRLLLALRAALRAQAIAPADAEAHLAAARIAQLAAALPEEGSAVVRDVVREGVREHLLGGAALAAWHATWVARHGAAAAAGGAAGKAALDAADAIVKGGQ